MWRDCNWRDSKAIDRWADKWREDVEHDTLSFTGEDDPYDELRKRLERGDFAGRNKASVVAYLKDVDANAHRVSERGKDDREERAAAASERSSGWTGWAIAVTLAALSLSAWPYVKYWIN